MTPGVSMLKEENMLIKHQNEFIKINYISSFQPEAVNILRTRLGM